MSEQTAERPAKKAKQLNPSSTAAGSSSSLTSVRAQLPSLLAQLNGGNALDLTVLAAINATAVSCDDASTNNPHSETLQSTIAKLFADHAGKTPEIIIGNAIRLSNEELQREGHIFNKRQTRTYNGNEREKWLNHPISSEIEGPNPDGKVWLELFLGEERAKKLLEGTAPYDSEEMKESNYDMDSTERAVWYGLKTEASQLSTIALLGSILSYIRAEASKMSLNELLRFSVLYGLDGVMKDILLGNYGDIGDISVNSLVPLDDKVLAPPEYHSWRHRKRLYMPLYAMGAILGHCNIVVATLLELDGGNFDAPYGAQMKHDEEMKMTNDHSLPTEVFYWIFQKNMHDMIKCLVNECGFQFRWIDHENYMPLIFERLLETHDWEDPPWDGDIEIDDYQYENSRERRRMRTESAYKEQMKMLDLLISLGFPLALFFPTEPPYEREEKLQKEQKLKTRQECKDYEKSLSKEERKARENAYQACSAYNSMQTTEQDTLTLSDFFGKLKSRWEEGQESAQVAKLNEFEPLDSRWRKLQRQRNGEEDNESDYESEDGSGSSYGSFPDH